VLENPADGPDELRGVLARDHRERYVAGRLQARARSRRRRRLGRAGPRSAAVQTTTAE
jgi:hypothetical protein